MSNGPPGWSKISLSLQHQGPDGRWIFFEERGGAYTQEWMVTAALDRIYAKIDDNEGRNLHRQHALDQLHLLCHDGEKALLYNPPIEKGGLRVRGLGRKRPRKLGRETPVYSTGFSGSTRGKITKLFRFVLVHKTVGYEAL